MTLLIFPHQLYADHPGLENGCRRAVLIEDALFFGDPSHTAAFHKRKLALHRASMKRYERRLAQSGLETLYLDHDCKYGALGRQLERVLEFAGNGGEEKAERRILVAEPDDFLLKKRLLRECHRLDLECVFLPNPGFLNTPAENRSYREGKKRWFMADFYKFQRKKLGILLDGDQPFGGKWSFDDENRKKVPRQLLDQIPQVSRPRMDAVEREALEYVEKNFPENPGHLDRPLYPSSHLQAQRWLETFLLKRFHDFGPYEDAIVEGESWLWHSVLTPMLNIGLLTPDQVIRATLEHADLHEVPLNSLEGFLRQVIGWREFMRATYDDLGVSMRNSNHWGHRREMPSSFYRGDTGILPFDDAVGRLLDTGYCHHIERLMVLGGFMFLCELEPDQIYRWFMEMFVDSYDWVMVPNVYAMSQHADGGLITTKPYFSGSNYIRKMSHYKSGDWCQVWDALYWRWIWNHSDELANNPRWAVMCSLVRKMDSEKLAGHLKTAERFLEDGCRLKAGLPA